MFILSIIAVAVIVAAWWQHFKRRKHYKKPH